MFNEVVVTEEFTLDYYPLSTLKRLLEGHNYAYSVKCGLDQRFKFNGPVIFVSNNSIDDCNDKVFLAWLLLINANCFAEDGPLYKTPEVKAEVEEMRILDALYVSVSSKTMYRLVGMASCEWLYSCHANQTVTDNQYYQKLDIFSWISVKSTLIEFLKAQYKEWIINKIVINIYNTDGCKKIWRGAKNGFDKK